MKEATSYFKSYTVPEVYDILAQAIRDATIIVDGIERIDKGVLMEDLINQFSARLEFDSNKFFDTAWLEEA